MKIYKIISLSLIILLCVVGIYIGMCAMDHWNYEGYPSHQTYVGGVGYTGIQNAVADTARNVASLISDMSFLINVGGNVILVCFFIKLLTTVEKLIEAIIDCQKYYAEKKKEKKEQMMAYQNYLNQTQVYVPPVNEFKTSQ